MSESNFFSLFAFEVRIGKGHFVEVDAEFIEEEEGCKEGWKDASDVRGNINQFKKTPVNFFCEWRPRNP